MSNENDRYVVTHSGKEIGPLTVEEIQRKVKSSELLPIDYVYLPDQEDWILLGNWSLLKAHVSQIGNEKKASKKNPFGTEEPPPLSVTKGGSSSKSHLQPTEPASSSKLTELAASSKTIESTASSKKEISFSTAKESNQNVIQVQPRASEPAQSVTQVIQPRAEDETQPQSSEFSQQTLTIHLKKGSGQIEITAEMAGQFQLALKPNAMSPLPLEKSHTLKVESNDPQRVELKYEEPLRVGEPISFHIQVFDQYDNLCQHPVQGQIQLNGKSLQSFQCDGGQTTEEITFSEIGNFDLQIGIRGLHAAHVEKIHIKPGKAKHLKILGPTSVKAGQSTKIQLQAVDQFGNPTEEFDGNVELELKKSAS